MAFIKVSLLIFTILCYSSIFLFSTREVQSKEIEVTNEWTLLNENDTIPKGVHVRMDMTTGEKWVKLNTDGDNIATSKRDMNDYGTATKNVALDSSGNVISIQQEAAQQLQQRQKTQNSVKEENESYDYEMMYRTLSKLPKEEHERMGGLPELPDNPDEGRGKFEKRLKEIWLQRQEELRKAMEENVVNFPQILLDRIESIKSFLNKPCRQLQTLIDNEENEDFFDSLSENTIDGTDIIEVLTDLEYQLSDIDMARDFYTMGGWPLLLTLLSNELYICEDCMNVTTSDSNNAVDCVNTDNDNNFVLQLKINEIQRLAAWVIGTMFKNIEEFHPLVVGEVSLVLPSNSGNVKKAKRTSTTVLSTLVTLFVDDNTNDIFVQRDLIDDDDISGSSRTISSLIQTKLTKSVNSKRQKILYALGSLLRGNRLAQRYLASNGHAYYLAKSLQDFFTHQRSHSNDSKTPPINIIDSKTAKRTIALADDIVSEAIYHSANNNNSSDGDNIINGSTSDSKIIIDAFTTKLWCDTSRQLLLLVNDSLVGERKNNIASLEETILKTMNTVVPYCISKDKKYQKQAFKTIKRYKAKCSLTLGLSDLFGDEKEDDSIIERLQLADVALKTITANA